jgi:hypothetical protein
MGALDDANFVIDADNIRNHNNSSTEKYQFWWQWKASTHSN